PAGVGQYGFPTPTWVRKIALPSRLSTSRCRLRSTYRCVRTVVYELSADRGTQPVLLFGRIASRARTHTPELVCCCSRSERMFDVPSLVDVDTVATACAVGDGAARATTRRRTKAQCEIVLVVRTTRVGGGGGGGGAGAATSIVTVSDPAGVGGTAASVAVNVIVTGPDCPAAGVQVSVAAPGLVS